jgi:hypothetical protein
VKAKHRTALVVAAPIVAVATLMVGLRVGAGEGFYAALVYGAHPGKGEPQPYAFQLITYYEERGVREAVAMKDLAVEMRTVDGHEVHWKGESNEDGVAEVTFALPGHPSGVAFDARIAGEREPLAFGIVDLTQAPSRGPQSHDVRVRPSKNEGALAMDVFLESGRLVVGSPHDIWVRVDGGATIHAAPEIGLAFLVDDAKADCNGYARFQATALGQAASTQFEATTEDGKKGVWFGTLPTAPGAFSIQLPPVLGESMKREAIVIAPNPRKVAYVEVDDVEGRAWAAALPLAAEPGDPLPRAHVPLGDLPEGDYWLVASGDPRGAERMTGATIAKRFRVSKGPSTPACDAALASAQILAPPTPRWLAIDGIATRGAKNRARHRTGLYIGLLALGAAALLETLLLTQAAREARLVLAAAESDEPQKTSAKSGNLMVALLVALLGFAFLAALMVAKA